MRGRARRRRRRRSTSTARRPPRRARDVTLITYGGSLPRRSRRPSSSPREGIEPRSSTCARCGRSTTTTIARLGARDPPRRDRRRRLAQRQPRGRDQRADHGARLLRARRAGRRASAAPRCRCRTPSTSRTPRCRSRRDRRRRRATAGSGQPMAEFRMPSLGADMDAGTLVEWLVKPGRRGARAATSSPWSTPTRRTSRSRSSRTA